MSQDLAVLHTIADHQLAERIYPALLGILEYKVLICLWQVVRLMPSVWREKKILIVYFEINVTYAVLLPQQGCT